MCMYPAAFHLEERQPAEKAGGAPTARTPHSPIPVDWILWSLPGKSPLVATLQGAAKEEDCLPFAARYSCSTRLHFWTLALWSSKMRTFSWLPSFSSPTVSFSILKMGMKALPFNSLGENDAWQVLSTAKLTAAGADVSKA